MEDRALWERLTTWPLLVLGVAFVLVYSIYILWVGEPPVVALIFIGVLLVSWVAFILDVVVRIVLTPKGQRWAFIRSHPIDVLSAILPVFRGLKVVDLLRGLPWFHARNASAIRIEVVAYAVAYVLVFIYFISLSGLEAERGAPGATILNFGDAVWWAFSTMTTAAYGDVVPVTALGRVYAVMLMISGLAIFGVASGVAASYVVDRTRGRSRSD